MLTVFLLVHQVNCRISGYHACVFKLHTYSSDRLMVDAASPNTVQTGHFSIRSRPKCLKSIISRILVNKCTTSVRKTECRVYQLKAHRRPSCGLDNVGYVQSPT